MNKIVFFLIPIIFLFQTAYADVVIENDQKYIDDDNLLHIVGEIVNYTDKPISQIEISATTFSSTDSKITTINSNTPSHTIMPGMKAGFDILFSEKDPSLVSYYELNFNYKIASAKNQVIEITSSEISRDSLDNLAIVGTVTNQGEITANMINVVATLYDRDGNVVTVSKTQTQPDFLKPGDENFFLVPVFDKKQASNVVDYTITAESDEYTVVPEFPLGSGILLAVSVSSYIFLTRNPKLILNGIEKIENTKRGIFRRRS
jgi:hypothetical protein